MKPYALHNQSALWVMQERITSLLHFDLFIEQYGSGWTAQLAVCRTGTQETWVCFPGAAMRLTQCGSLAKTFDATA